MILLGYHGTSCEFSEFSPEQSGFSYYFALDRSYAEHRARVRANSYGKKPLSTPRLITAEIKAHNSYTAPTTQLTQEGVASLLGIPEDGFFMDLTNGTRVAYPNGYFWPFLRQNAEPMLHSLRKQGYDSIIMKEGHTFKGRPQFDTLVVFDVTQIKILSNEEIPHIPANSTFSLP